MIISPNYKPEPTFLTLGQGFGDEVEAADFPKTIIRYRNDRAANEIGLDGLTDEEWANHFGRFNPLPGNLMEPIAQRYHGHQFRHYNPDIGDGRGFLFAQMRDQNNRLMDLGTKGSGRTPYSRSGDGRLTLKGGYREILATELLEALGVYTSRTLSIIETGESLHRGDEPSPTRSAVMVRLNHGHIRIGTFQRLAYFTETELISKLVDYCLTHYYSETPSGSAQDRALKFLSLVTEKVAIQAAELMAAGFVHGVLNTDNINITGEVFDFGPWRFLPTMDLAFTAAYFDEHGLYSFGRQPDALHWNIYQLGGALADICEEQALKDVLAVYPEVYLRTIREKLLRRLGIRPKGDKIDDELLTHLNKFMTTENFPYERFFFDWYGGSASEDRAMTGPEAHRYSKPSYGEFIAALKSYNPVNEAALSNAYFLNGKPCTMLIEEVEELWSHIAEHDDWKPFHQKLEAIREMGQALA
ncbi:YdiU family protein [Kordiimonas sp. SCSIO 12603]|uniref:protein adenylyltransferase SelO family protein n=1 Tax=Kordiimonas sp. SCSIO 12603 TaxID=2829596 RepID=UPI00210214CA|nr:YdiU family protein [Kordiimonas sp. SCSIO 12603]UTW58381.1 YdiU family protein [Kordiimonas sp. SCSIO 12603]